MVTKPRPLMDLDLDAIAARHGLSPQRIEVARDLPSGCEEHPDRATERSAIAADFAHFLPRWRFTNRETGAIPTFATLWEGQREAVEMMKLHRWLYLLKAGKLGFTELECAFDAWALLYRHANMRVHLFSKGLNSAKELLGYVRFGVEHLPDWLSYPMEADKTESLVLRAGPDDKRTVVSFPAVKNVAIDQSAGHTHVDELARMPWPADTWSSIESTIAPDGTVHVVTRGAGLGNFTKPLYDKAVAGDSPLVPFFAPWWKRPRKPERELREGEDPQQAWYAEKQASWLPHQLKWFAPQTAQDALTGSGEDAFVHMEQWLPCYDPDVPPLQPGDRTPAVMGVDAGVTDDYFAIVLVTRHPANPQWAAVRNVRVFKPEPGREIDFDLAERFIRTICVGGCPAFHPNDAAGRPLPVADCEHCAAGTLMPRHNIVQVAYDAYQLAGMMQRLRRDQIVWARQFGQGEERMRADHNLRVAIIGREITHPNDANLNRAVENAMAKSDEGQASRLRIVKRSPAGKIDELVAVSMAREECLRLIMENAA